MVSRLSRRQFVQGMGSAGVALVMGCALPTTAPPPARKVHRVGNLTSTPPTVANAEQLAAFRDGLRALGYVDGQDLVIEWRSAQGEDQVTEPAAELLRLQPDVILVPSTSVALAVRALTTTVPIVTAGNGDLVAFGLAASMGRPGGNVTGLSTPSLMGKQLQLLQETVPSLVRVAVLFDGTLPTFQPEPFAAAARALGVQPHFVSARRAEELEAGFDTAVREQAEGLWVANGALITANQARISELAVRNQLPSIWGQSDAVGRGALMAYGPNREDLYRRAATYVDKILKGANPAEIPVEQPTKFDFTINLQTARALGLTIPPAVLAQATEVIQ
jgi:putative ABC transport system substrate-binding protein